MLLSSSSLVGVAAFSLSSSSSSSCSGLSMISGGRSPLTQQYKNILSIHGGMSSSLYYPRMAPPGEPEPEVRGARRYIQQQQGVHRVCFFHSVCSYLLISFAVVTFSFAIYNTSANYDI
jgi:hypothetical protein